ncbi:MAG: NifB/NifX family molybdenum-iron cluster-binding protein [Eubacteriales bacterium]|nr:NifB/NifX family molybdenum-iron cluster-binding protein [Eubacteriales bacterium]
MKIAIPVNEDSMNTTICISFGRTPYFLIYDTETKDAKFLSNHAAASQGGAGIKAAQMIIDNQAEALLTPRCGENAADVFKAAGIKIYQTKDDRLDDTIQAFEKGELSLLNEIHPGFHNHGGK